MGHCIGQFDPSMGQTTRSAASGADFPGFPDSRGIWAISPEFGLTQPQISQNARFQPFFRLSDALPEQLILDLSELRSMGPAPSELWSNRPGALVKPAWSSSQTGVEL